jgi:hypothetical protein
MAVFKIQFPRISLRKVFVDTKSCFVIWREAVVRAEDSCPRGCGFESLGILGGCKQC